VWVGNPNGYVKMNDIPEFVKDGVRRVQGGTYPEKIWKAFMDAALINEPNLDWPAPPGRSRPSLRLYLPGADCLGRQVSGVPLNPNAPTTSTATTEPPPETEPPSTVEGEVPVETEPATTTTAPPPVVQIIDGGTTIPPDVLDPKAPLPAVDMKTTLVFDCLHGIPGAVVTNNPATATTSG
jgi:penicillin-binding protein 1A